MAKVECFTFNPFQENTYVVYDETGECVIFDPGCSNKQEETHLLTFLQEKKLRPVRLINTHCHIDHILGNAFVADQFDLGLEIHSGEEEVLNQGPVVADMYGIAYSNHSPAPSRFIEEGSVIEFGATKLKALFTPGHSPASLSFYCAEDAFLIAGDVLFFQSIGRTDLPGGDFDTLSKSIKSELYVLPDEVVVYPGHGPKTRIGYEKMNNPFVRP
jgi:hydroxyacylglutathione hydrolase